MTLIDMLQEHWILVVVAVAAIVMSFCCWHHHRRSRTAAGHDTEILEQKSREVMTETERLRSGFRRLAEAPDPLTAFLTALNPPNEERRRERH